MEIGLHLAYARGKIYYQISQEPTGRAHRMEYYMDYRKKYYVEGNMKNHF